MSAPAPSPPTELPLVIEIGRDRLQALITRQLGHFFEYDAAADEAALNQGINEALERCRVCFSRLLNKYFRRDGHLHFSPFHSGQYCIFLYYLGHSLARAGASSLADRVYYLNRALNSVDLFHQVHLPDIFCVEHPLGSVIGRAQIGDFFFFAQGVTVGGNRGAYPVLGKNVTMLSNSKVVGRSVIGDNVILAANSYVKDAVIPPNSIVFGQDREMVIKENKGGLTAELFDFSKA
ncbi:MAG: transferase [Verrucomicrobiota bacterium]